MKRDATEHDLFDLLDVSRREDTYSRVIVAVLRRHPRARGCLFETLTGRKVVSWDPQPVRFREALPDRGDGGSGRARRKSLPDIRLVATTSRGVEWLLIETKVKASEGKEQCGRYLEACQRSMAAGRCDDATVYLLTLDGHRSLTGAVGALSHADLVDALTPHVPRAEDLPGLAWSTYVDRVEHHRTYAAPGPGDGVHSYLERERDRLVTRSDRVRRLASALTIPGWATHGAYVPNRNDLVQLRPAHDAGWRGARFEPGLDIADCFDVHLELLLPLKGRTKPRGCAIHFETHPYLRRRDLPKKQLHRFQQLSDLFETELHARIEATEWRPRSSPWQKAWYPIEYTPDTTVDDLRAQLAVAVDQALEPVTEAIERARREWAAQDS